ncbi:MAG TPA: UvrD-helicase domain-containing protein [Acidimicrobiia bacterium]|nr:UvrD-helicase domain-containing protein [Acidimicrobiia bacterium]
MAHPDVAAERARLRFAQECLDAMRERTAARIADEDVLAANKADADAVKWQLQRRLASLDDDASSLCFGRIDEESGDQWYIGRRHVEDGTGAPVVVDWRAEVATAFYRATLADPFGLHLRRRFIFNGRDLADVFDEDFSDPDSLAGTGGVPDPLLAELGRARTGQMRDIVATIQTEQDTIIRAPLERCLVVQGGPGTGKTAVGLHRAAFLLYEHRVLLAREGVLVVGPNPVFLRYISQVLPSLGETSATQTTVDGLLSMRFRVVADDAYDVAAVKGDARMQTVIARAAEEHLRIPDDGIALAYRARTLRLSADELLDLAIAAQRENLAISIQRQRFRDALIRAAYALYTRGELLGVDEKEFGTDLLANTDNRKQVDNCWKSVNPVGLVRSLLTQKAALARAAAGVLTDEEQARLLRPRADAAAWTAHDLALLDEAETLVKAMPRRFGHVVVDEAQDLSPMQLRMLARRARRHSMTVLGDLAQATGPASPGAWEETLVHLGRPANAQRAELTMGYRVPGAILELANRLLPHAAPDVAASRSVRESGDPPDFHEFGADELVPGVVDHALALAKEFTTVAVIAEDSRIPELRDAIEQRGVVLGELGETSPEYPLVVVPASLAKGLEFDAVLLVEPAEIMAREPHGVRLLFVALTRAVQHLGVAYVTPVPSVLRR